MGRAVVPMLRTRHALLLTRLAATKARQAQSRVTRTRNAVLLTCLAATKARQAQSRVTRTRNALLLASLALMGLPAMAHASETAKLHVNFVPYTLGSTSTIDMVVDIAGADGGLPSPVTGFAMQLPPELELVGSTLGLAVCQPAALLAGGLSGCSPNARLGSGSAMVEVPFGPEVAGETANIEALMGPPVNEQIGVLIYAESTTPVFAQMVFPGALSIGLGPETLATYIPPTPTLPGAPDAAVTNLRLSIGPDHLTYYKRVHGRQVGYQPKGMSLPSRCPRGGFRFVGFLHFEDGIALRLPYAVPCQSSRHR